MVVKQIWTESHCIHWWEVRRIFYSPELKGKKEGDKEPSYIKLYDENDNLIHTVEFAKDRNCNFKLYFMENGHTVDTMAHVNKL